MCKHNYIAIQGGTKGTNRFSWSHLSFEQPARLMPPGWPPLSPKVFWDYLAEGYVLTAEEMGMLKSDADQYDQLMIQDPAFARAARRQKTQEEEELRNREMRQKLEEKNRATARAQTRIHRERQSKRVAGERARARGEQSRQQVEAEREKGRQKLVERIAVAERRTLVRHTIQKALVSQSRSEGNAERVFFTDARMLGDNPGPGAYEAPPAPPRGTSFAVHPSTDIRSTAEPRPGPGSYNPSVRPQVGGAPSITFGSLIKDRGPAGADMPGPGSYQLQIQPRKGGVISKHIVKSFEEINLEKAAYEPGPGAYEPEGTHEL